MSAASDGDDLVLRVRDTGVGVRSGATHGGDAPTGFGLRQVTERIETAYAGAARFTLAAATDDRGGSVATLRLPRTGMGP